jgi:hypothetical protein
MTELIFLIKKEPEGGYTARAVGASIFTEADTQETLKERIYDAVRCHFGDEEAPELIRVGQGDE